MLLKDNMRWPVRMKKTEFPLYTKENSLILCQQLAHVLVIRLNKLLHQVHMPCSFPSRMLLRVSETKALSPRARLEGISHVSCNPDPSPYVSSDNRKNHWNRITLTFPGYAGCEGAWRVGQSLNLRDGHCGVQLECCLRREHEKHPCALLLGSWVWLSWLALRIFPSSGQESCD